MCVCVQVRKRRYVYVVVVVAAACFAVLARAVRLSLAMLLWPVVRQQRKSGYASWNSMSPLGKLRLAVLARLWETLAKHRQALNQAHSLLIWLSSPIFPVFV